ncbi:MAG: Nif3-like dinuclear metal center hexameric protein [Deltaproteobacteria bacterium]|nr:MAG: Nif3-like dinuclear metal center hexameric protein [Deltaproteobacteria bacterium]
MRLASFVDAMQALAPLALSEGWDNVGLLAGAPTHHVSRVLACIDLSHSVIAEALAERCDTVVCYHPPLMEGLKSLAGDSPLLAAVRHGLAIYSPHTAWDVALGGANDALADALGLQGGTGRRALRPAAAATAPLYKLVVFVPEEAADAVSTAACAAGAGQIGAYAHCTFRSSGMATFLPGADSHPAVGQPGELCRPAEVRLEVVVPEACLQAVGDAVRGAHPYEEPVFDVYRLAAVASQLGIGRIGCLPAPQAIPQLIAGLKAATGVSQLLHVAALDAPQALRRVAVCVGAGDSLLGAALRQGCELYVTGELRHHAALRAKAQGCHVICMRHASSERPGLQALQRRLEHAISLPVRLSQADHEPFAFA